MRAIGFQLGMRGDLCMATVAARSFKEQHPGSHLTLGIGPQYADMLPLFAHHPYIDDLHVYHSYDGWPDETDLAYLRAAKHDVVFNGMPPHRDEWWRHRHQYAETCHMVGLPIPSDIKPILTKWFDVEDMGPGVIAFAPFAGYYAPNNDKRLSVEQAQIIVKRLRALGHPVLQIGGADEPQLDGAIRLTADYFASVRYVLGCKLLLHTDTGMGHIIGAYNHPSVGIYASYRYDTHLISHIQPLHSRFRAVVANTMPEIDLDTVIQACQDMLASPSP